MPGLWQITFVGDDDPRARRGVFEQPLVVGRERLAAIEHEQNQIRDAARLRRARHALAFDHVQRVAPAGGVHQRQRQALDLDLLAHEVARGARDGGHNRSL